MYLSELKAFALKTVRFLTSRQAQLFENAGIKTVYDLIRTFPYRYDDRSRVETIETSLLEKRPVTVIATVVEHRFLFFNKTRHPKILVQDGKTRAWLVGFNRSWLARQLEIGKKYYIHAEFIYKFNEVQSSSFDFEPWAEGEKPKSFEAILPVYRLSGSLGIKEYRGVMQKALDAVLPKIDDELPDYILKSHNLATKTEALRCLHLPPDMDSMKRARLRLAYEEFLSIQLAVQMKRRCAQAVVKNTKYNGREQLDILLKALPYPLTQAQERSISEILSDMDAPHPMHRLLHGDVGSGKTTVAALAMAQAALSGFQTALLVPTEVLAYQHFRSLSRLFKPAGIRAGLLTGGMARAEKDAVLQALATGSLHVVTGTHALFQDDVTFKNLRLLVFDEQHKFGVEQRMKLSRKAVNPDILVMTATPIPRTLTMTLYGDLSVSVLDELPQGRIPVITKHIRRTEWDSVLAFVTSQLEKGRQAYFVYPLIEESEKSDAENATRMYKKLKEHFTRTSAPFQTGLLHGRMPQEEKEEILGRFRDNQIQVLVSTTVIEVGVDVPNAAVVVVDGADRFGLSQLHQLRGRVGRGAHQSYAMLVTPDDAPPETLARMDTLVRYNDGFKVAEEDLRQRGPGEILGVRQSGLPEITVADFFRDEKLLLVARADAENIMKADPELSQARHISLRKGFIDGLPADFLHSG